VWRRQWWMAAAPQSLDSLEHVTQWMLDHLRWASLPTEPTRDVLLQTGSLFHLPWWATIASAGLLLRVSQLPFQLLMHKELPKLFKAMPLIQTVKFGLLPEDSKNWDTRRRALAHLQYLVVRRRLLKTHGYSGLKRWSFLSGIPIMFIGLISLREVLLHSPDLRNVDGLWFSDLLTHDPFGILPVTCITLSYLNLHIATKNLPHHAFISKVFDVFKVGLLCTLPLAAYLPTGICLLWFSSSGFQLMLTTWTRSQKFQLWAGYTPEMIKTIRHNKRFSSFIKEKRDIKNPDL